MTVVQLLEDHRAAAGTGLLLLAALNWYTLRRMAKHRTGSSSVSGAFDASGTLMLANLMAQTCMASMVGFMGYLDLPASRLQVSMLALAGVAALVVAVMTWLLGLDPAPPGHTHTHRNRK